MAASDGKPAPQPSKSRHSVRIDSSEGKKPERRQIYARDTRLGPDAPLRFIEAGEASVLRPDCHAGYLICPVPGCEDPRYTARGGSKRDHFAHLRAPTDVLHAPERYYHIVGKKLIGEWLRGQHPEATVQVDHEAVENGQIPDVLATFPNGRRFAFEVQYSPLTLDEWHRRHKGYETQGIVDIWLFGHLPPHMRLAPYSDSTKEPYFVLSPLEERLMRDGYKVRWINPDERTVHTLMGNTSKFSSSGGRLYAQVSTDPLAECTILGNRFITPTDIHEAVRLAMEASRERARQECERQERARQQREGWERDRLACERQERTALWLQQQNLRKKVAWEKSQASVVAQFGCVPPIIADSVKAETAIFGYHPQHWRYLFFQEFIQGRVGRSFDFRQAYAHFVRDQSHNKRPVRFALIAFLFKLRNEGYVDFPNEGGWIEDIKVLKDIAPLHRYGRK